MTKTHIKSDLTHLSTTRHLTKIIAYLSENGFATESQIIKAVDLREKDETKIVDGLHWLACNKILIRKFVKNVYLYRINDYWKELNHDN